MEEERKYVYDIEDEVLETKVEDGKIKIDNGLHSFSKRAKKFKRLDRVTLEELNVALEYFDYRCAYTGQRFVSFNEKASNQKNNLSIDHVIALVSGGHNIAQNMIPSVIQYNISKNGYHLLDWYKSQVTPSGEKIYNPYRLLKIYNYMAKSLSAMELKDEEYRQAILTKNELDNYLETKKEEMYSDEITTYEVDEDGTKLLQKIPTISGSIANLEEEQKIKYSDIELSEFMNNILLELQEGIDKDILQKARETFENLSNREKVFERIPKEEKAQAEVIEYLKTLECQNSYTIARTIDISKIIEQNISAEEYLKTKIENIQKYLTNSNIQSLSIGTILDNIPQVVESENISEMFLHLGVEIPEYMEELQSLDLDVKEKKIQNINVALQIVNQYNFEKNAGRKLTEEEKKILVESILTPAILKSVNKGYLSTLYKNIMDKGMNSQEAYGAIINYAIGNNGNYTESISSVIKIREDLKTKVNIEDITYMVMTNGIISEADKKQIEELKIDILQKDVKNVNAALKIVNEYNFEENVGRNLTDIEKKILVENILKPTNLNSHCYLSTLYKNIMGKGNMDTQEAYGAIINYAIGDNDRYSAAIGSSNEIQEELKTQVNIEDINQMLMKNGIMIEADKKQIDNLEIDVSEKHLQNIHTALKIVNEYNFEENVGRNLTDIEKKILVESILTPAVLKSVNKVYLSTLYKNIMDKGMNSQEAYGAIINYAIGNNSSYSSVIGNVNKIQDELKTEISMDDINQMLMNNGIMSEADKKQIKDLGIDILEKRLQNVYAALKIANEYNFEASIGRNLTDIEKKILVEAILNPSELNSNSNSNCYLSTLYKNIMDKGMNSQEAYGAIINYAIGNNGSYSRAVGRINKIQDKLKTQVNIEDINQMLMKNGIMIEADKKQIDNLEIDVSEKNLQNIHTALEIVNEYNFEASIERNLTDIEKKILVENILNPSELNNINNTCYLSTLYKNIMGKGNMDTQEAYGTIINYAIGNNGSYGSALSSAREMQEELKTQVNIEDINQMLMKNGIMSEIDEKQIKDLEIDVSEKRLQNVYAALKIVNEYNFEVSIERNLTDEEKKIIIERMIKPANLNNNSHGYLSTLYKNITKKGLNSQEAYGAIINYAIGNNGSYGSAISSAKNIREELKKDIRIEDIKKIKIKAEKKAKKITESAEDKINLIQKSEMKQQKLQIVKSLKESIQQAEELYEQTNKVLVKKNVEKGIEI